MHQQPPRPLLREVGHDVVHVHDRGLDRQIDETVLEVARREDRILISADTDFGELLAESAAALPSLLLFRQGNRSPEHQMHVLVANLAEVSTDLASGAIVVLTNDRIRIRRLPVR